MEYYEGRDHIRQNATGDIAFECLAGVTRVYVESGTCEVDFSGGQGVSDRYGNYLGSFPCG